MLEFIRIGISLAQMHQYWSKH